MFYYRAYNLVIRSEVECPEFSPVAISPGVVPDVTIRYGDTPARLANPRSNYDDAYVIPNQHLILLNDNGTRIWVRDGKEIVVTHPERCLDSDDRMWLLDTCFGVLLHQRGALVLHGSAIETRRGVVAFVGASGNGKSTTAAVFHDRGYNLMADDICAITLDKDNRPLAAPSFPRLKLWEDMTVHLGKDPKELSRLQPHEEKYGVPVVHRFAAQAGTLDTVYVLGLSNAAEVSLRPLAGGEKLSALLNNIYRPQEAAALGLRPSQFHLAANVAKRIRVCHVERPAVSFLLDTLVTFLEVDFERED